MLDDALEGHAELADIRPGARLRLVATQERVDGAFARWASLDAVEYFPAAAERARRCACTSSAATSDQPARPPRLVRREGPAAVPRRVALARPAGAHRVALQPAPHAPGAARRHAAQRRRLRAPSGHARLRDGAAGVVQSVGNGGPCGNMVQIAHAGRHHERLLPPLALRGGAARGAARRGAAAHRVRRADGARHRAAPALRHQEERRLHRPDDAPARRRPRRARAAGARSSTARAPPSTRSSTRFRCRRKERRPPGARERAGDRDVLRGVPVASPSRLRSRSGQCGRDFTLLRAGAVDAMLRGSERGQPRRYCVRKWLRWASFAGCGAAIAAGCGGSGGGGTVFDTGDASSSSGGSSGGGQQQRQHQRRQPAAAAASRSTAAATARRAAAAGAAAAASATRRSTSRSPTRSSAPTRAASSSGSQDSGGEAGEAGIPCSPTGVTCQGTVANNCSGGVLTTTDCATLSPPETCANGFGCVVCQPGTGIVQRQHRDGVQVGRQRVRHQRLRSAAGRDVRRGERRLHGRLRERRLELHRLRVLRGHHVEQRARPGDVLLLGVAVEHERPSTAQRHHHRPERGRTVTDTIAAGAHQGIRAPVGAPALVQRHRATASRSAPRRRRWSPAARTTSRAPSRSPSTSSTRATTRSAAPSRTRTTPRSSSRSTRMTGNYYVVAGAHLALHGRDASVPRQRRHRGHRRRHDGHLRGRPAATPSRPAAASAATGGTVDPRTTATCSRSPRAGQRARRARSGATRRGAHVTATRPSRSSAAPTALHARDRPGVLRPHRGDQRSPSRRSATTTSSRCRTTRTRHRAAVRQDRRHGGRHDAHLRPARVAGAPARRSAPGRCVVLRGDAALPRDGQPARLRRRSSWRAQNNFGATCVTSTTRLRRSRRVGRGRDGAVPRRATSSSRRPTTTQNWVNVIAPTGASVTVDGDDRRAGFAAIGVERLRRRARRPLRRQRGAAAPGCTTPRAAPPSASRSTATARTRATCTRAA